MAHAVPALRRAPLSGAVIVGGGPAGSAAAITLARAGAQATLIERNAHATDKVCGDFLAPNALAVLARLGVDVSAAPSISRLRLVHRTRMAETRLPFVARGMSRRLLDEALLRQAEASGSVVLRGHRVGRAHHRHGRMELNCGTLGELAADALFLATGKHELRGLERQGANSGLVGLKMYYALAASQTEALRDHIELVLFPGGYAGLQLVESDRAVLCALVPGTRLRAIGGRRDRLLDALLDDCPHLRIRLSGARVLLERPLAVAYLPYGYLHAPEQCGPAGMFRLGDQAAVIASLTGEGVGLALASGTLAARSWLTGESGPQYHRRLATALSRRLRMASLVHRLCLESFAQPTIAAFCSFWPGLMRFAVMATRGQVFDA